MADEPDPTRSKVGRLIDEHGTVGLGQELEDRWLGRGYGEQSLRSLAEWFNERLLHRRLVTAGYDPLDGEVSNLYRLLSRSTGSTRTRSGGSSSPTRRSTPT